MLQSEQLISLEEWAEAAQSDLETSYTCVFTQRLWDEIEARPFAEQDEGSQPARIRRVIQAASKALDRLTKDCDGGFSAPGSTIDFAARLASRATHRPWRILRLHAERVGARLCVTLGTPGDFVRHPMECCDDPGE